MRSGSVTQPTDGTATQRRCAITCTSTDMQHENDFCRGEDRRHEHIREVAADTGGGVSWSEHSIASALARQTFQRKAIVITPNCNWTGYECDLLVVTGDLRIIDVEIKISRADLKADASKSKWWEHYVNPADAVERGLVEQESMWDKWKDKAPCAWPAKVWKHYYAVPYEIWDNSLLDALPSEESGVIGLTQHERHGIITNVIRRATPNRAAYVLKPEQAIDIARLANLRYWTVREALDKANAKAPVGEAA